LTYCYYSPGSGTVPTPNPLGMPAGAVTVSGEPINAVVACDLGRAVVGVVNGVEAWRRSYPSIWPRAIEIFEGLLFVGDGTNIHVMNPATGFVHRTMAVPSAPAAISGLSVTRYAGQSWVICSFSGTGAGTVRGYTMSELALTEAFVNPQTASHPRHATLIGGWVFVADTFGHRVYGVTLGGAMRDSTEVYYPNHLQALASDRIMVTAEHENRVFVWDYSPTHTREMVHCAPVAPFNDIAKTKADIVAGEGATLDPASTFTPKKSLCAVEGSGANTLYSPNSSRLYGTDLLVADTDNHRVVLIRAGSVVSTMTNLNNPVTAVLF